MISTIKVKFLLHLLKQSNHEKGFTLIELLVVMIILGVLAAVALPNFISQAGKAREVEFKNAVGTINRAQQAYHWEKQVFAEGATDDESLKLLNVDFDAHYVDSFGIVAHSISMASVAPTNSEYDDDQTRAYSGATFFVTGVYNTAICQSQLAAANLTPPVSATDCGTDADLLK